MALTTIKTASLPDDAITSAKIADDAVTSALIADEAVDEVRLQISNAGTNGQYLQKQSGNTGGLTWADSTGGGGGGATGTDYNDNVKVRFGTGNDLEIYHDASNSYITDTSTGNLKITSNGTAVQIEKSDGENMAAFKTDGACELYYDNVKTLATSANGATFTGAEGSSCELYISADEGDDNADKWRINALSSGSVLQIGNYNNGSGWDTNIECNGDGNVELYHDNTKKVETTATGVTVTGGVTTTTASTFVGDLTFDNGTNAGKDIHWDESLDRLNFKDHTYATFGSSSDLQIYHNGTSSYIDNSTGNLNIVSDASIWIGSKTGTETYIKSTKDDAVELYHNNVKKLETLSDGVLITGQCRTTGDFAVYDDVKFKAGSSSDLQIYHDGSNSYIKDTGTGVLVINGSEVHVNSADNSDNCGKFVSDGAAELYYDGAKKLETSADGVKITSTSGNRNLKLSNTGGDYCYMTFMDDDTADDGQVRVGCLNEDLLFLAHAAEKGRFTADGLSVTGHIDVGDNEKIKWGDGGDLEIYHDGNQNLFKSSNGRINFLASETRMESASGAEVCGKFIEDGAVELYFNNVKKFDTKSDGVNVYGQIAHAFDASLVYGHILNNTNATGTSVRFESDGTGVGSISITTSATSYNTSSDYRLKENEVAISDGITRLKTLKPYRFNFKSDPSKTVDGFFAHEVTAVPEAVTGEKDGGDYQEMDYGKITPLLTAALQEAIAKIETLETEVAALKAG